MAPRFHALCWRLLGFSLIAFCLGRSQASGRPVVSVLMDPAAGTPARIALGAVEEALARKGVEVERAVDLEGAHGQAVIVAGLGQAGSASLRAVARDLGCSIPSGAETVSIHRGRLRGRNLIVALGGDSLGLAYALYDIADRIDWSAAAADPLSEIREASERPHVRDRAVSTYTMQQAYFEQRLFDEAYWKSYFDTLVRCRFNGFSLLFGYESSGFFAPPYPWFFDLPDFPGIRADGVTAEAQRRYVGALNRVIDLAHERGLHFTVGIWDHTYGWHQSYYTKGVWDHLPPVNGRQPPWPVQGLDERNLVAYTQAALRRFLELVPHIDALQFRMHRESGLGPAVMEKFWQPVFLMLAREHPDIRFDARAKNVPRDLIETAIRDGVPLRIVTKYFLEQVPLPFHLASPQAVDQFNDRESYFDMLSYPRIDHVLWQQWTSGTMRILWWGDPEFVRRFSSTTHLYDGDGFELAEPLATKMASEPHDLAPIPIFEPDFRYGRYEFQRYWPFFRAYGRFSYDPDTPAEAWEKPFVLHFGAAGIPLERALGKASWILPHVIEYCMPQDKYATTRGWPERQRWDDLPVYASSESSDPTLFAGFVEEARLILEGKDTAKVRLETTSAWFHRASGEVLAQTKAAEAAAGPKPGVEFICAVTDLKILGHLAEYHSRRIQAGLNYALYKASGDVGALDEAIAWERRAVDAWSDIVDSAGKVYADNLALGLPLSRNTETPREDMTGHWRDELPRFAEERSALEAERASFEPKVRRDGADLAMDRRGIAVLKLGPAGFFGSLVASKPVPNGFYEVTVGINGPQGPMQLQANGVDYSGTFTVPAGERVEKMLTARAVDGKIAVVATASTGAHAGMDTFHAVRVDPLIAHVPIRRLMPGEDLVVRATVAGVDEIRRCELTYGDSLSGFHAVPLRSSGGSLVYRATIPGGRLGKGGTEYFIEAEDAAGRVGRWPESGRARVLVSADVLPPLVRFTPILTAVPGRPLRIVVQAGDPSGIRWVRVRYRSVTHFQDYRILELLPTGHPNEFAAEIPGVDLDPRFDFMYFIEAMDGAGNGAIYPDMEKETPYVVVNLHP